MYPMLPTTGMVTLPQVFASAEAWNSSSFFSSKVFCVESSWLKTLMTFWPLTASSTKAFTSPIHICCLTK